VTAPTSNEIPPGVLLDARRRLRLSRRAVAEETGLTEGVVWRIETKGTKRVPEAAAVAPLLRRAEEVSGTALSPASAPPPAPPAPATTATSAPGSESVWDDLEDEIQWLDGVRGPDEPDLAPNIAAAERRIARVISLPPPVAATRQAGLTPWELAKLDGRRRITLGELQTLQRCPRKWWLAWYRGLRLRAESPVGAAAVGGRVHEALRAWYVPSGAPRTDPREALERLVVRDWTALVRSRRGDVGVELTKQFTSEAALERAMVEGYVQWLAETGADSDLQVTGSEAYLEATLEDVGWEGEPAVVVGKLDVRVRRISDNRRLFIDHKTLGDFVAATRTLHLDPQMLHYHLLEWLNSDGADDLCTGALYNMMRRVRRTGRANPPFYERIEVSHNHHELKAHRRRLVGAIARLRSVSEALDSGGDPHEVAFSNPTRDCAWSCEFFAVCGMFDDGSRAEAMLDNFYESGDPTYYYRDRELSESAGGTE